MKFHFVKSHSGVAITAITVGVNVLIPAVSLAASKSEIDRSATQALTL